MVLGQAKDARVVPSLWRQRCAQLGVDGKTEDALANLAEESISRFRELFRGCVTETPSLVTVENPLVLIGTVYWEGVR